MLVYHMLTFTKQDIYIARDSIPNCELENVTAEKLEHSACNRGVVGITFSKQTTSSAGVLDCSTGTKQNVNNFVYLLLQH